MLQKEYKATLVDIKGLNKHFYKECDRCLKAYNIFIEGINKHLYEWYKYTCLLINDNVMYLSTIINL